MALMSKIVVAGGTGFIGRHIVQTATQAGHEAVVLSRGSATVPNARVVQWDGKTAGAWKSELEGAAAVINLAGTPVDKKWTPEVKQAIRDSRVQATRAIGEAVRSCETPPTHWINASAVGFYGDRADESLSESSRPGQGFLAETCLDWESALFDPDIPHVHQIAIRVGVVLGNEGGALPVLAKLTKGFLGGPAGPGSQFVSWIHVQDLARLFLWAASQNFDGPINGTAPNPVTNAELMAALRERIGRPPAPPAPAFMVQIGAGLMGRQGDIILHSQKVFPTIPLARGFEFGYADLPQALANLLDTTPDAWKAG